jgi:selenocysteine-specific elongation factor
LERHELGAPGVEAVRLALADLLAATPPRAAGPRFFLPLDRVFALRGFGTIGTGTLRAGEIRKGQSVEILPARREATVRGLQTHNEPIERALPGQRVAVNLRGVDRGELKRGDTLATPGFLRPTRRLDVELGLLEGAPRFRNGATVRVLLGTTEAIARLRLLDRRELGPGETALAQLRCDREIATQAGERFIVRSHSPMVTIGGGGVLDAVPERHRRFDAVVTERLASLASGDMARIVEGRVRAAGNRGVDRDALSLELGVSPEQVSAVLEEIDAIEIDERHAIDPASCAQLLESLVAAVSRMHESEPLRVGVPAAGISSLLSGEPAPAVLRYAVDRLVVDGRLAMRGGMLSLPDFDPFAGLGALERNLVARIERQYLAARFAPPPLAEVIGQDTAKRGVFRLLLDSGRLVQLRTYTRGTDLVLHSDAIDQARRSLESHFPYPRQFAVKDVRDLLGSTRKHVVPLMEHFDATGVTARHGDLRSLRGQHE